jgi:peptidyl-tRNA hydrolase ICT1
MSLVALRRLRVPFKGSLCRYTSSLPIPPSISVLETPEDTDEARSWISKFQGASIPRNAVELQFARSSGPGGQVFENCSELTEEMLMLLYLLGYLEC